MTVLFCSCCSGCDGRFCDCVVLLVSWLTARAVCLSACKLLLNNELSVIPLVVEGRMGCGVVFFYELPKLSLPSPLMEFSFLAKGSHSGMRDDIVGFEFVIDSIKLTDFFLLDGCGLGDTFLLLLFSLEVISVILLISLSFKSVILLMSPSSSLFCFSFKILSFYILSFLFFPPICCKL